MRQIDKWNQVEAQRAKKFQEIRQAISHTVAPDVDLEQEAIHAIEEWKEGPDLDNRRPDTLLQKLLSEYLDVVSEQMNVEDEIYPPGDIQ